MPHPTFRARFHSVCTLALLALLVVVPADRDREEDVLVPERGREVEGFLVRADKDQVVFRVGSRDRIWQRDEVAEIRSPALLYGELAERLRAAPLGDVEAGIELAQWCAEVGLEREATYAWWRVIAIDWSSEVAHEALGSKLKKNGWQVRLDRRWMTREKLLERIVDWGSAFEVETSFHQVRTSSLLEDSLASIDTVILSFDLIYREFGDLFELSYPRQMMAVHLHGSEKSFPPMNRRAAYFEKEENRVSCDCSSWYGLGTLAHEVSHQILSNAYTMVDDGRGQAPGWLDEGLAEVVAALVEAQAAGLDDLLDTERARDHLRQHMRAERPFDLSRVLNFDADQFHAVDGAHVAYAQAFSLVVFLLKADDGAYVERFQRFVAMTFDGKFSGSHFEDAMEMDVADLEELWIGYVQARVQDDD